jgi:hypothetical protein
MNHFFHGSALKYEKKQISLKLFTFPRNSILICIWFSVSRDRTSNMSEWLLSYAKWVFSSYMLIMLAHRNNGLLHMYAMNFATDVKSKVYYAIV